MKRLLLNSLCALMAIFCSVNLSAQSNMVCNESFETWTAGKPDCWFGSKTGIAAGNVNQYTTSVHSGASACQLIVASSTHQRFTTQPVSVVNGTTYQITFWVRGQGDIRTALFDDRSSGSGYSDYNPYISINSTSWAQHTQEIAAANTSAIAEFIFSVRNTNVGGDHIQIDDVEIVPVAIPGLIVSPTSLPFGSVDVGTTAPAQTITVSGTDLTGNINYNITGGGASAFDIGTSGWNPATGGTLSVTFTPAAVQTYSATITFSSDGATNKTVTLSGTGVTPSTAELVSKWNGYATVTSHDPIFLATGGSDANDDIATLTRDAAGAGYAVNADGVAASTTWEDASTIEKYWITEFSTVGFTDLTVTSKQRGSNTGPKDFKIQYKVGASGAWTDVDDGVIVVANDNYVIGVKEDLPLPPAMENQELVFLRWICTSTVSIGNGVVANTGVNRLDVAIYGEAAAIPVVTVNPLSLDFGNVENGTTSTAQTITVSGVDLTGNITYAKGGTDAAAFDIAETSWNAATGGTLSVTFSPTADQSYSATITISSDGAADKTVTLSGTGVAPSTAELVSKWNGYATATSHDPIFLATGGSDANDGIATLTRDAAGTGYAVNADGVAVSTGWEDATTIEKYWITEFSTVGFTDLTVTSKQRGSGTGPKDFKIQYKVGASGSWTDVDDGVIEVANDNYVIGVKEDLPLPPAMDNQELVFLRWLCTSTVSIGNGVVANTGVNRLDVAVYGEAVAAIPEVTVNPTSLSFGNIENGTTSSAQTITVSGADLTGNITYAKGGTDAAAFDITETSWNAATGGTLSVTFSPTTAKAYNATITISSDGATDKTVTLSGTGVTPAIIELVAKWNGYATATSHDPIFLATGGSVANDGIATLTRDVAGTGYAVNADGVAVSTGWEDATTIEKYWITAFSTVGFTNLTVTSKQRGSNTGPKDFKIQYKVGAFGTWTNVDNGVIEVANDNYIIGVKEDLPLPAAMDNQEQVFLRWICTSTVSIGNGVVANTGVNRLDVAVYGETTTPIPVITVNPLSLDFGNVENGTTAPAQTITVSVTDLIGDITYLKGGADATAFTVTQGSWNPATGGTISVTFSPTAIKAYSATITFSSDDANDKTVILNGTGVAALVPTLTVSPTSLPFGNVNIGTTSPAQTITVSGTDLTGNITYDKTGADAAAFDIVETSWNPATGGTLSVTFSPTAAQAYSAIITFSSDGATDKTVTLSGTGTTPATGELVSQWNGYATVTTHDPIFLATDGSADNSGIATLTRDPAGTGYAVNTDGVAASTGWEDATTIEKYWITEFSTAGFTDLTVTSKQRGSNTGPKDFKIQYKVGASGAWTDVTDGVIEVANDNYITGVKENLPLPSAMDNQGQVFLRWICTSTAAINGGVVANTGVNRLDVVVYGEATTAIPAVIVNPLSLNFGNVEIGTTSPAQTITVSGTNLTGDITYVKGGTNPAAFDITQTSWNPATGGTLSVTFSPTAAQAYSATIVFSSAGATDKTVTLSGTGATVVSDFIWADSFEYAAGSLLTSNGWTAHSGGGTNPITVSAEALSYLNYAPSGVGNKVTMTTSGEDDNHPFPSNVTSGTLYAAFMVNLTSAQEAGDYFAHFIGQSTTTLSGRVFAKSEGTGYQLGVTKAAAATSAVYANQVLDFGTTYLVVMKYEIVAGNTNDLVSIFVNPTVGSPEPTTPSAIASDVTGTDPTYIAGFALRQGSVDNAPALALDGIRVAGSWSEAVKYLASTDPTLIVSPTLLAFGNVDVGETSSAQTITVSGANLTDNITYVKGGTNPAAFTITETSWNPATGGTLSVTFSPTAAQAYSATIVFSSAGADNKTVNLTGTGISITDPPVADFTANKTTVVAGESVQFTDLSTGNPTSWSWSFTGGTPASSTQQNPTIAYNTVGSYTVALTATNANGSDTKTMTNYITVVPPGSNMVCNNSFETWTDNKPDCWFGSKTSFTTANVVQYTTSAHTGASACQLIETTSTHKRFTSQTLNVVDETTYQITFWVRGQGEIRTGLFDDRSTGSGYATYNPYIIVNSTSWTQYTQEIEAANTTSIAEFIFSVRNTVAAGDHIQIDDVEIIAAASVPGLTVTPESLSFGSVLVGSTSGAKTLTISGHELTGDITYVKSGADAAAFAITETSWDPATGGALNVTFSPTEARAYNAIITVSSPGVESKTVPLTGTGTTSSGNFFEDFENLDGAESTNYSGKEMTFASGLWYIKGVTSTTDDNDRKNGARSVRLRGNATGDEEHRAEMMFDKPNGAGMVSFKYASYSSHAGGELQLQLSTDQGATWTDYGDVILVPSWVEGGSMLQNADIEVNIDGDIRIRLIKVNAQNNSSINIDDIEIADFNSSAPNISVSPTTLAFGDVEVQTVSPEKTVTVSGINLTGNIIYAKGGADATAFTITETSWNPATGGTLSVVFAPTETRAYSAIITFNSEGAAQKTVTLSGTGTTGGDIVICNGGFEEWTAGKPDCWFGEKTTFAKASVVQYSDNVHGGNYACQLINTESAHRRFSTQPVTVVAEQEYFISFWVRGKGDIRTALFDARDGNNGYTPYNEYITIDSDVWTQYTQSVTAENSAANAEFIFSLRNTDESADHIQIDDVEIYTPTAIVEIPAWDCLVYPNPTTGELRVESGELRVESVEIFDVMGRTVLQSEIGNRKSEIGNRKSEITLDISNLPTGIYFLRIKTENGVITKKVVKQ